MLSSCVLASTLVRRRFLVTRAAAHQSFERQTSKVDVSERKFSRSPEFVEGIRGDIRGDLTG
jgi:hypothetical protein